MTSNSSNNNNDDSTSTHPCLPPLVFAEKSASDNDSSSSELMNLPPELLQHCVSFCDWGDLSKLATVQTSWKSLVKDAADFGGHEAQWELSEALLNGTRGLAHHPARAMTLLKELAGVTVIMTQQEENDDNSDNTTALSFQRSDTKQPFAPAMQRIASGYLEGMGVEQSSPMGVRWLEAAHNLANDVEAAHKLALLFEYGEYNVEHDVFAAAEWFRMAAQGGHVEAMAEYAMCCELGCGRDQSDEEALEWYMKAANQGHITSNYSVGEAFEEARGVPQSDEEACLWYYKAASVGDEDSKKALRRLHDIARIVLPGLRGVLNA